MCVLQPSVHNLIRIHPLHVACVAEDHTPACKSYKAICWLHLYAHALPQEREVGGFKAEAEEEFEDAEGNVYNKRTYEDLKRQGLI